MIWVGRDLWRSSSSTSLPKQGHLDQVAQDLVQAGFEYLQRRRLHKPSGQPVPVLCLLQSKKVLPRVQMDLPTLFLMHPRIPLAFFATRAHGQLVISLDTQVTLCRAAVQQVILEPVMVHGVVPPQMQDPALALVELHQVHENGSTAFQCIRHSFHLCVISKLAKGTLYLFFQVIDEEVEQDSSKY